MILLWGARVSQDVKVLLGGPATHVGANLGEQTQGHCRADRVDLSEIDTRRSRPPASGSQSDPFPGARVDQLGEGRTAHRHGSPRAERTAGRAFRATAGKSDAPKMITGHSRGDLASADGLDAVRLRC